MKRLLLGICTLLLCIQSFAYDFEFQGFYFKILSETEGTCELVSRAESDSAQSYSGFVDIPFLAKEYRVNAIAENAFSNCTDITSISIPDSVFTIGDSAFYGCYGLTSITNLASTPQAITSSTFTFQDTLHVLPGCGDAYRAADVWKDFNVILEDAVDETGINRVVNEETVSPCFSIDGNSVATPASPGIYIRNKKKLLIR